MLGNSRLRQYLFAAEKHLFRKPDALFGRVLSPNLQALIRRTVRNIFLSSEGSGYQLWQARRIRQRQEIYKAIPEPGLLSFVTSVWNTPVEYLDVLAQSLLRQSDGNNFEWVVLDNGSENPETIAYLESLKKYPCVELHRVPLNLGIIGGVRYCFERARNRYIVPLDSDDFLYPDTVRVVIAEIQANGYPALLYTDEDKLLENKPTSPYFKPGWDPVLFLNSAYTAHLGIIDREFALKFHAYTDSNATGSHDWDTFVRFLLAGYSPVHIPEVLYSWRMHPQSTAANIDSKKFIHSSQRAVLQRYLDGRFASGKYRLEYSPLFNGTPDWWIRREHNSPAPLHCVILSETSNTADVRRLIRIAEAPDYRVHVLPRSSNSEQLRLLLQQEAEKDQLVLFLSDQVQIKNDEWFWDALTLMEIHPDTVMVGGRIYNGKDVILDAGRYIGFGKGCDCPDRGRSLHDPGYFATMWKQRSVSAVSTQFCIVRTDFMTEMLGGALEYPISLFYLGAWAGAHAIRTGKRVIYSPFFTGLSDEDWQGFVSPDELAAFVRINRDIIPDRRFFSKHLSLEGYRPYMPATLEMSAKNGSGL